MCNKYDGPSSVLTKADLARFVHGLVLRHQDLKFLRKGTDQAQIDSRIQEYIDVVVGRMHFEATCGGAHQLTQAMWNRNSHL